MKRSEPYDWAHYPHVQAPVPYLEKRESSAEFGNLSNEVIVAQWIEQYQPAMLRVAQRYVSSLESAQDVVGETWLAFLRGYHRFEGRSSLKTWLFAILLNRSRTRGKQERRLVAWESFALASEGEEESALLRTMYVPSLLSPEEQVLYQELGEWIKQAIMTLPPNLRQVILLRDVEGATAEETCAILRISEANQRVLLHRARGKVRQILERLPIHEERIDN
ncbi:MAG: RNA polymerase sigma factor [Caldilineaceae bacterium]